jgi:hypothetical protein
MSAGARSRLRQTAGRRELDCLVINATLRAVQRSDGSPLFTTVRGLFTEGAPLFSADALASGIHADDHIQIGVADQRAVRGEIEVSPV